MTLLFAATTVAAYLGCEVLHRTALHFYNKGWEGGFEAGRAEGYFQCQTENMEIEPLRTDAE